MILKTGFKAVLCLALSILIVFGCKEDDPQPAVEYQTQGFARGKFTGKSGDNTYTFNEDFHFTQYSIILGGLSTYAVNENGSYTLVISRANFLSYGAVSIQFDLETVADTTPDDLNIKFEFTKELSTRFVTFSMESHTENMSKLSDIKFDLKSGRCTGKFSLTGLKNSTAHEATVAGEFDVIVKELIQ